MSGDVYRLLFNLTRPGRDRRPRTGQACFIEDLFHTDDPDPDSDYVVEVIEEDEPV